MSDRNPTSNDELFDRPSTSAGVLDLSPNVNDESEKNILLSTPAPQISISPTETCVKPCCAVEQSDEKFHPNICNGSNNGDSSESPVLENESSNSGATKIKGAIQTV